MMRRTPLKRGTKPLRRAVLKASATSQRAAPRRIPRVAKVAGFPYVRSRALLDLFKSLPCQISGRCGGVDPAHSNWSCHGKGGRIKASDIYVAAIARDLHRELDQGSRLTREERQRLWWDAHVKSVRLLVDSGRWPAAIPLPDINTYPF